MALIIGLQANTGGRKAFFVVIGVNRINFKLVLMRIQVAFYPVDIFFQAIQAIAAIQVVIHPEGLLSAV